MANFIEYASKAQDELNGELQRLSEREKVLAEQASLQASRAMGLDKRESAITEAEGKINAQREELSIWEAKKKREEQVDILHGEALKKDSDADDKLKKATDALIESRQNLEELTKRELALSERESKYREEIKQEIMNRFLGVK